jgi:soluble P-type ATPase
MNKEELLLQLDVLYRKCIAMGDTARAAEIAMKIADLTIQTENKTGSPGNILLG